MIEFNNVTKIYKTKSGPRIVLNSVNMKINRGDKIGILGRNGAGKSTLIRLLSGAEQYDSGYISRGMKISWPLAFSGAFQGSLTGLDNLKFVCRVYGTSYENKISFVREFADLGKYFQEPVKTYSSGMRSRLAFAISLAVDFDCYLIDEVFAVGDSRFHEKCELELFVKRKHKTFIIVSHDPAAIRKYCERAFVLESGQLNSFRDMDSAYMFYNREMTK